VISNNEDYEFKSNKDYSKGKYLQMERETIPVKSNSFYKGEIFGPVVRTLKDVKLIRYV